MVSIDRHYHVYILASKSRNLYVGVTSNLIKRVHQHKTGFYDGFTSRYNINRLVYFEEFPTPEQAIEREKQIKKWRHEKKARLIEARNPAWDDLSAGWFEPEVDLE